MSDQPVPETAPETEAAPAEQPPAAQHEPPPRPKTSRQPPGKGFARLTPEQRSEVGRAGGRAVQRSGRAHTFSHEEAVAAGKKGGKSAHAGGNANVFTSESGRAAGAKGGRNNRKPTDD